jgi:ketosteroid isomerase-like protein
MSEALRERVVALYAALRLGQLDFVLNAVDDDIEFISYSPIEVFPFFGHRRGKAAMAEVIRQAHREFEFFTCEPIFMVLDTEGVAVILFIRVVHRMTGRSVQQAMAHFIRLRDGKIVELRQFMDSFDAAEQVLGRRLIGSTE